MIGDVDQTWHRLEVRHLVTLEAIATTGSFRAAARTLGYSPSAVSEQIGVLEEIVGERLVDRPRGTGGVRPTAAGRLLLHRAESVGVALAAARADLVALRDSRPPLRVGIYQSAAARLLPTIMAALRDDENVGELRLHEAADDHDLLPLLAAGELDVAFVTPPPLSGAFATVALADDPYVLLVALEHSLARAGTVTPDAIADLPLIDYRTLRSEILPTSRLPPGARPRTVVFRTDDHATIHSLVAAGIGVAILPRLGVDEHDPRVRAVPIVPPLEPRRIAISWLQGRETTAVTAFVAAARAAGRATATTGADT